ncbi:9113_t:CDS:10 [Ambispora gerdemannii]|uniref:9113_t:CDS:1 n=1 Tax=Ambispora gerdemannii TaxID=144530 RepID=A0A9N9APN6_9GLOM|nr:9113_t:CDS:10 [Ambispora gerdemannii]
MTIKGRQLFVGNLPFVVGWQDLKDLFRSAGNVQRANIMQGRDGRSKGHGIVLYATVADAQKAISTFDGYEWHGRKLEVREDRIAMEYPPPPPPITTAPTDNNNSSSNNGSTQASSPIEFSPSENNSINGTSSYAVDEANQSTSTSTATTVVGGGGNAVVNGVNGNGNSNGNNISSTLQRQLFVGNLPFRVRWQDLKDLFRKAGTVLRADVAMGYDNRSKGHGTVLFATLEDAKNAIEMFNNYNWQSRTLEVREDPLSQHTQSLFAPPGPMMPPGGIFYGLPFNCQWQDLKDLFRNAGNIIRADVSTNYDGRSRGFGTVLFATPEDARNAVGRILRVHFDKFTLPNMPPHPHHPGPHPPPHLAVHPHSHHPHHPHHPHHRPPPHPLIPHSFHMGLPPPIPHHFMAPAHIGPFSPPLTTPPPLTSPPPYPTNGYNPLAHHLAGNTTLNSSTNGNSTFQPIPPLISSTTGSATHDQSLSTQSHAGQFPGFGPIGKNHFVQMLSANTSLSGFGSVGATFPANNSGANGNGIATTTTIGNNGIDSTFNSPSTNSTIDNNGIQSLNSAIAGLHLNPNPSQPLFFHPHHHPHHPHHRPGGINGISHLHQQQQLHNTNALSHTTGTNGASSSSSATSVTVTNGLNGVHNTSTPNGVIDSDTTGSNGVIKATSSASDPNNNSINPTTTTSANANSTTSSALIVPSAGLWNNSAATMLTTATTTTTNGSIGIEMASLAAQSVYVRNI